MAAKFFTGLPLAGPDPECVFGHGAAALATADRTKRRPDRQRPLATGSVPNRPPIRRQSGPRCGSCLAAPPACARSTHWPARSSGHTLA